LKQLYEVEKVVVTEVVVEEEVVEVVVVVVVVIVAVVVVLTSYRALLCSFCPMRMMPCEPGKDHDCSNF